MCDHHTPTNNMRHGAALEHGEAHERDHQQWSRRGFLKNMGIASGMSMLLGNVPLTALTSSPLAFGLNNTDSDRILVLIRLKGGNDGLNTIIPIFDYGTYIQNRSTIGIPQNQLINLSEAYAMPNTMEGLSGLWNEGSMKVINSVGYPDQNLSHFRSSDIWASASDSNVLDSSGWLGRLLDTQYPDFLTDPPEQPPAIQIGGTGNILFNNTEMVNLGVIVNNPEELAQIAQNGELYDATAVPECYYGEQLGYMRAVANSTFTYAEVIADAYSASANTVDYQYAIGEQLALVARLIKGGLSTRLYVVTLDGFDTHALQSQSHPFLMFSLSQAVQSFYQDLAAGGVAHRVLASTFSEFGRRIGQNASNGTDHGAAAPMLLFGEGLNGNGFLGQGPDLHNLDSVGNLQYDIDFRQVYATLLEDWLCIDPVIIDNVMGQSFERLPGLGLECMATSTSFIPTIPIEHRALYGADQVTIEYTLVDAAPAKVEIFNILGQPVTTLFEGYQSSGTHQAVFRMGSGRLSAGIYVYVISAGRQRVSQKIKVR
ncbi:MAG: DUF1501 domain-containing protein [Bacteroidota bacterium]